VKITGMEMKAWLITWEWVGEHVKVDNEIAAILNSRLSSKKVIEIIELLYMNASYTFSEQLAYVKNKRKNPYPPYYGTLGNIPWLGEIYCGHNPYLYARQVRNLRVQADEIDKEILLWDEIPKPAIKWPKGHKLK
jgi:hypothetical protein